MKITTTKVLAIICGVLLCLLFFFYLKARKNANDLQNQTNLVSALTDTVRIVRNKDSSTTAIIQSYSITNSKLIQEIKNTKDSATLRLQELESKYRNQLKDGGSITSITSNTKINNTVANTVKEKDTIVKNNIQYVYPEYTGIIAMGKWINGYSIANKDSTYYNINIYNEVDAVISKEKGKWKVEAIMKNPYSETKTLRALNVIGPKPKRFGIGIFGGYGATYINKEVKLAPMMGIGLSYHLINF